MSDLVWRPLVDRTSDIEVHVVHISRVIKTYTLESLSSLTQIRHNVQVTISITKLMETKIKSEGIHYVDFSFEKATLYQFTISLRLN